MLPAQTTRPPELVKLQRCVDLLTELERELVGLEWDHAAGRRSAEFLGDKFRDLLAILENVDAP